MTKDEMLTLLRRDVVPALGCTEPVCVALCAAGAGSVLTQSPDSIAVEVNSGIYKNGMSAGIPGCSHVGLAWAAAIGTQLKNPEKSLTLLEDLTDKILIRAEDLIQTGSVTVALAAQEPSLYVKCTLRSAGEEAVCIIRNSHTGIVHLSRNGEILVSETITTDSLSQDALVEQLKEMTIAQIHSLVCTASENELDFLMDGVAMNETLAAYSQHDPIGIGLANTLRDPDSISLLGSCLMQKITLAVTSAAESRLDGCRKPTMSSSGAGTKGLVVILPVSETAKYLGCSRLETLRALAFAHLVNRYINAWVGKLSPMCSCVMCSSTAASAGIACLLGADEQQIGWTIRNMCGTVTGMICDGGKVGCAMKVATGSFAALLSAQQAVNNVVLRSTDGICAETPEQCIRNMARIGQEGMADTDRTILQIMESRESD